jgi:Histidine kinase-like ATPase domain
MSGPTGIDGPGSPLAAGLRWRRVFPGRERELAALRRWLTSLLPECPAREDVLTVANELASNAIQHTLSGHGAWFAVEVGWHPTAVQVAVADCGGPAEPHVINDPGAERGRGLLMVQGLPSAPGTPVISVAGWCGRRSAGMIPASPLAALVHQARVETRLLVRQAHTGTAPATAAQPWPGWSTCTVSVVSGRPCSPLGWRSPPDRFHCRRPGSVHLVLLGVTPGVRPGSAPHRVRRR